MEFSHDTLQRLDRLEQEQRKLILRIEPPQLHEVRTVEPVLLGVSTLGQATHVAAEALRPWLVPLTFNGVIDVVRASAMVSSSGGVGSLYGLAIYRASPARKEQVSGTTKMQVRDAELVANLGSFTTASAATVRFNADPGRPVTLDSRRGTYFAAFTGDAAASHWWCPGGGMKAACRPACHRAVPAAETVGRFPEQVSLSLESSPPPAPWISLRSEEGVRLFGEPGSD
tara:strand:- start:786 stop:1469 length:684 start_codon:yes stop_codon:yes gene_type:complete